MTLLSCLLCLTLAIFAFCAKPSLSCFVPHVTGGWAVRMVHESGPRWYKLTCSLCKYLVPFYLPWHTRDAKLINNGQAGNKGPGLVNCWLVWWVPVTAVLQLTDMITAALFHSGKNESKVHPAYLCVRTCTHTCTEAGSWTLSFW